MRLHSLMGMMLYLEQKGRTYAQKHIVRLSIRAIYSANLSLQIRFMLQRYNKICIFANDLSKSSLLSEKSIFIVDESLKSIQ